MSPAGPGAVPEQPSPFEPELADEVAARRRGLRNGWTTGTCASAAAKAAAVGLESGTVPGEIEVGLPAGTRVSFAVKDGVVRGASARAIVVKDAGDDPDCTDGAEMTAEVRTGETGGETTLHAGAGVGTITKPGLGLPVGAPAINPVPRKMILAALREVTARPLHVTFSVPGGEQMAEKTTNARLGIVGGISILGTTGIVRPFSTAAYRASVVQQIDVAAAQGEEVVVLATGHRSETAAMALLPELDEVCFVEVGDFTGIALRQAAKRHMAKCHLVAMAGKITKLAAGVMMTHFHRSEVDTELLAGLAEQALAPEAVVAAARATATARYFFEVCVAEGAIAPLQLLCQRAKAACEAHTGGKLPVEVWMVDFEGSRVVASA
jgi:cobalt-precorrin-5B (C1)-methyltransferase